MKIMLSTFGTQGDIQPYIALGKGLKEAGHTVAICTSAGYQSLVEGHGLHHTYLGNEMLDLTRGLLDGQGNTLALIRQMPAAMRQTLADEWKSAQSLDPDAIIHHPKMLGSYHIAEKLGIPLLMSIPLPFYTPTRAFPNPFFGSVRLGEWFNRLSYQFARLSLSMYIGMTNTFRTKTLGLSPQSRFANLLATQDGTPLPILYPYSPEVLPVPADFPSHVHVTGYWFLDQPADWQPPAELAAFLEAGPPPVYIGFGSMGDTRRKERGQLVLDALARSGQRGVIASGWGAIQASTLPESVFMIDAAPHDWLFPRMAAVVHHGGAGTTAAGLRAGKPSVICPFLGDQPFWGRVVEDRQVGPPPIPQRKLTAERLADAIRVATTDTRMQQRASELGTRIRQEDGVGKAVRIIEQFLQSAGVRQRTSEPIPLG